MRTAANHTKMQGIFRAAFGLRCLSFAGGFWYTEGRKAGGEHEAEVQSVPAGVGHPAGHARAGVAFFAAGISCARIAKRHLKRSAELLIPYTGDS